MIVSIRVFSLDLAVRLLSVSVLACGCGTARPGPGAATVEGKPAESQGDAIFQADVAPIVAMAFSDPFLWIGSDRGLRRVRLPAGVAEWVGPAAGMVGRRVSALAVDGQGGVLVATEAGIGRVSDSDGRVRYQPVAVLPGATHLAPQMSSGSAGGTDAVAGTNAGDGIWAGTPAGLSFLKGGMVQAVDAVRGVEITSLDIDLDGRSVWVGARGRGLLHVEGGDARAPAKILAAFGPESPDHLDFVETLGTALLANGTRIAVGRGAKGGSRVVLLRMDGPQILVAQPDVPVLAIVVRPGGPLLVAGSASTAKLYRLGIVERGDVVDEGGFRFAPEHKSLQGFRLVARPDARGTAPEVTVALAVGDDVFVGTRAVGVAKLARGIPDYLPAGELSLDARGLSVACVERERCVVATGTGPGWTWDGRDGAIRPIPDGAIGGGLMAVAGDGAGAVYFIAGGGAKSLQIARLSSDGARWDPVLTLPVQVEGSPLVTFATLSPQGNLWMAIRDRISPEQEFGRGVIELQLPSGRAIHHRVYRENEQRPDQALSVAGDVSAIRFAKGTGAVPDSIWFCTSVGVMRFAGGDLSRWGENEGLDNESCLDLTIAGDGTVWVATEAGPEHFDGKDWRRFDVAAANKPGTKARWPLDSEGESVAARALVATSQGLWAGSPRGVWPLIGGGRPMDRTSGLVDDDVKDLVLDRFGRLWNLGHLGLTVRRMPP